jgi:hypothetical protein
VQPCFDARSDMSDVLAIATYQDHIRFEVTRGAALVLDSAATGIAFSATVNRHLGFPLRHRCNYDHNNEHQPDFRPRLHFSSLYLMQASCHKTKPTSAWIAALGYEDV